MDFNLTAREKNMEGKIVELMNYPAASGRGIAPLK